MKKIVFLILVVGALGFVALRLDFKKNNQGCPFCQEEVLARHIFYRGDLALGILTHKPAVPGHVLIIPKRHVERFEELTGAEMALIQETIKKVDVAVRKLHGNKGYLLIQKNGRDAGQSVPHVHFHYLPADRFLALRYFISPWLKPLSGDEMRVLREDLSGSI